MLSILCVYKILNNKHISEIIIRIYYYINKINKNNENNMRDYCNIIKSFCALLFAIGAFILGLIIILLLLGLIGDGIESTNFCYNDRTNLEQCIKNGLAGLMYVILTLIILSYPTMLMDFILNDIKPNIVKQTYIPFQWIVKQIYTSLHWFIITMTACLMTIGWLFLAPLLGVLFLAYDTENLSCISYNETFVVCGICGGVIILVFTTICGTIYALYRLCKYVINKYIGKDEDEIEENHLIENPI